MDWGDVDDISTEAITSLKRSISPPLVLRNLKKAKDESNDADEPTLAAVEAGHAVIQDHLQYFRTKLAQLCRPGGENVPRLSMDAFAGLYLRNQTPHGRHFVIHQHQHPVAGIHYDLRLQFSETSSVSWAIPYGLPGNPNSLRPTRMAIETRVHCVWNHLIESASLATGSLLIWDTGEYEVLARRQSVPEKDSSSSSSSDHDTAPSTRFLSSSTPENEKLIAAFKDRHIRLRLHSTRLPSNYTISLRLARAEATSDTRPSTNPRTPKRRRQQPHTRKPHQSSSPPPVRLTANLDNPSTPSTNHAETATASNASDDQNTTILTNAYPGATNSINSIHQRRWFLSLDRASSGFIKASRGPDRGRWIRSDDSSQAGRAGSGFEAFYVRGSAVERSIVTGRTAADVLADEGVVGFVERKGWRAILE